MFYRIVLYTEIYYIQARDVIDARDIANMEYGEWNVIDIEEITSSEYARNS